MSPIRVTFGNTCWKPPDAPLGSSFGGGFLICSSGGVGWIVAPASTQISTTWYCRNDAVTTAQSISGCTGWFIPTVSQLQNPGYTCRIYWDSFSSLRYWSNTEYDASRAWYIFNQTSAFRDKNTTDSTVVRAFRCVTY